MLKILSYEAYFKDRTSYQLLKFTHTTNKFSKTACSSRLFTPIFQYFYTDISAISVTFCNSAAGLSLEFLLTELSDDDLSSSSW